MIAAGILTIPLKLVHRNDERDKTQQIDIN